MIGSEIVRLEEVDSTNDEARRRLAVNPPLHGTVIVAARQSAGRGVGARRWISDAPDGLWLSVVLRRVPQRGPLPFAPALALVDVLRRDHGVDAHLKWPNDVLVGSRKIAGVLCESLNAVDGLPAWIAGLGVNVNQRVFPAEILDRAVSLRQLTAREHDLVTLLGALIPEMERWLEGGEDLVAAWRERTRMIGREIRARRRREELVATVRELDAEGRLVVERSDGAVETWVSASELEIDPGYASRT